MQKLHYISAVVQKPVRMLFISKTLGFTCASIIRRQFNLSSVYPRLCMILVWLRSYISAGKRRHLWGHIYCAVRNVRILKGMKWNASISYCPLAQNSRRRCRLPITRPVNWNIFNQICCGFLATCRIYDLSWRLHNSYGLKLMLSD